MKNKIITNTIIFIFIIAFVNIFQSLFGAGNSLVGVTIITTGLTLMERDLTIAPLKNFFKILGINLFSLVFSVLAIQNVWLGIIFNFIALFTIGYFFSGNLKKSIVVPFGLQYFFMLFYPAEGEVLFNRFIALIFGSIFIMLIQFVVNKDKLFKTGTKLIDKISNSILEKIKLIQDNKSFEKENIEILESINYLKRVIYDKRVDDYYLTSDGIIITDIIWVLERINMLLDGINIEKNKSNYKDLLNDIYNEVKNIKDRNLELKDIENIKLYLNREDLNKDYINETIDLINILYREVENISVLSEKEKKSIKKEYHIPYHFHNIAIHKRNFNIDSAKVRYAIRLGVIGAFTAFIAKFFNLSEGRWMCFTIFSLIQPYVEVSNERVKDRVIGTFIGGVIVLIAFGAIHNQTARAAIILLAGYLDPFSKNYKQKMVCVTVSAVASAAIIGGTVELVFERIIFVIIGATLTLFANKYIFPYKIKDMKQYLSEVYNSLISQMKEDIKEKHNDYSIRNLYLITGFIEEKMKLPLSIDKDNREINRFLKENKFEVSNIYKSFVTIKN
ncbi:FUSC family protein [uncultured Clostridium sp.]|uniref:FUSC family protein n=1 Tax=uncultured Clostridium sp. TaxID=59620 RepID=UPI0025830574|nr:FUSC family protein [uncultured Clostridium sp.]